MEQSADTLSTQLDNLRRERERLEHLLMLDANWRALKQLEVREAAGEPLLAVDAAGLKASLEQALASNRIYAARARLSETIELLSGADQPQLVPLANRIVLLDAPAGEGFRTRWRMKAKPGTVLETVPETIPETATKHVPQVEVRETAAPQRDDEQPTAEAEVAIQASPVAAPAKSVAPAPVNLAPAAPDALELIDGLGRSAVEQLIEGGVRCYADIASWSRADVEHWGKRLGVDDGGIGSWIEQAAILAGGRRTSYADKARRGDFTALVPRPEPLPAPIPVVRPAPVAVSAPIALPASPAVAIGELPPPEAPSRTSEGQKLAAAIAAAVLPAATLAEPAASGEPAQLLSAEELIRALASADRIDIPPEPPTLSVLRRAYVRPEPRKDERAERNGDLEPVETQATPDSEVIVVRRGEEPASAEPGIVQTARPRPQRLLRRLKQALEADRFEADGYAAYRGVAEEASVTIVRAEPQRARVMEPQAADPGRPATGYNRFLKALTGQRH